MAIHLVTGHGGTPHVTAADYGSFNASLVGTGAYIMDIGEKFGIEVISNNSVRVKSGDMLFQGRHIRITGYEDLTVDNGTQGENRNDLIVLRYERNTATGVETATLRIAKGTAASSPADPTITTGDIIGGDAVAEVALYRLPIAGITLGVPVLLIGEIGNFSGKSDAIHTHSPEDLNTPVPLGKGGTGATTAVAARTALGAAATTTYTATLSTTWSGSGPYTQTVSISGILASDNPIVDLVPDADVARARLQIESWGFVGKVTTAANSITVTCYDDKPTITLPIQLKVVR